MNRYENVPLSEKTREGMSLNIDDLAAIGRLLSLQDLYYDEQFEKIFKAIEKIEKILADHERRITCLERKFEKHIKEHNKERA